MTRQTRTMLTISTLLAAMLGLAGRDAHAQTAIEAADASLPISAGGNLEPVAHDDTFSGVPVADMTGELALGNSDGESVLGYTVWPERAWTANGYGYSRTSFRRGEAVRFYFTVNNASWSSRSARVRMAVRKVVFCPMVYPPLPGCPPPQQVLLDGYHSFPPGRSTWVFGTAVSPYAESGERDLLVTVDGDVAEARFTIR